VRVVDVGQEECEGQGKDGGEERMEGMEGRGRMKGRRGWRAGADGGQGKNGGMEGRVRMQDMERWQSKMEVGDCE